MTGPDLRDLSRAELIKELLWTTRQRNAAERREKASDAKRRKIIETHCGYFRPARDWGICGADGDARCESQCAEKFNSIKNGRVNYGNERHQNRQSEQRVRREPGYSERNRQKETEEELR